VDNQNSRSLKTIAPLHLTSLDFAGGRALCSDKTEVNRSIAKGDNRSMAFGVPTRCLKPISKSRRDKVPADAIGRPAVIVAYGSPRTIRTPSGSPIVPPMQQIVAHCAPNWNQRLLYSTHDVTHEIHRLSFSRNEAFIVLELQEIDEQPEQY
jgi:hypothetical protein